MFHLKKRNLQKQQIWYLILDQVASWPISRFVRLPVSGELWSHTSDMSSRDAQEVERGTMASSSSKTWESLQLISEEADAAEPQRPATAQSGSIMT